MTRKNSNGQHWETRGAALAAALSLMLFAFSGLAHADAVDLQLKAKVLADKKETPHLILTINERLKSLAVTLTREDGKVMEKKWQRVAEGGQTRLDLPVVKGHPHHFRAVFDIVDTAGESYRHEMEFDAELVTQPKFDIQSKDVNTDGGFLTMKSSRDISAIDVTVTDESGKVAAEKTQRYGVAPSGSPVQLLWGPIEGKVFRIDLTIHDTDGFHFGMALFPWRYDIPHDEVNFATGSAEIAASERPKLDASIQVLREVLRRMGRAAPLKLYIAGATDTVGDESQNQRLSEARALSIGRYFRKKGIQIPIFAAGLGERGLKVATADEVDEVKNRRADYIVTIEEPVFSGDVPPLDWKKVK